VSCELKAQDLTLINLPIPPAPWPITHYQLSGEGIRPAIVSGFKAAEGIDRALGGADDAKEPYTQSIAQECNTDMVWASRLARAFYQFTGAVYQAGLQFPRTTQLISKILCSKLRYADIANRAFHSSEAVL